MKRKSVFEGQYSSEEHYLSQQKHGTPEQHRKGGDAKQQMDGQTVERERVLSCFDIN